MKTAIFALLLGPILTSTSVLAMNDAYNAYEETRRNIQAFKTFSEEQALDDQNDIGTLSFVPDEETISNFQKYLEEEFPGQHKILGNPQYNPTEFVPKAAEQDFNSQEEQDFFSRFSFLTTSIDQNNSVSAMINKDTYDNSSEEDLDINYCSKINYLQSGLDQSEIQRSEVNKSWKESAEPDFLDPNERQSLNRLTFDAILMRAYERNSTEITFIKNKKSFKITNIKCTEGYSLKDMPAWLTELQFFPHPEKNGWMFDTKTEDGSASFYFEILPIEESNKKKMKREEHFDESSNESDTEMETEGYIKRQPQKKKKF